jgi:hypothetical protein
MTTPPRAISRANLILLGIGTVFAIAAAIRIATLPDMPVNPLTSKGESQVVAMDFAKPFALDALPRGWTHHKFWTRPAMQLGFVTKDGVPALRCETKGGGSIFGRWTDIDLANYPKLSWRWNVETPLASTLDERTREGDDHPVRWFLGFADSEGSPHHAEIVWGNKLLKRGDWKVLGTFVHYVADGGDDNAGKWRDESADLLAIYRKASGRADTPRLTQISVFCDSDETGGHTVAYIGGPVVLSK